MSTPRRDIRDGPPAARSRAERRRLVHERMLRRRRRTAGALGAVLVVAVVVVVAVRWPSDDPARPVAAPTASPTPTATDPLQLRARQLARASGALAMVTGTGAKRGSGQLRTYTVEVEKGLPETGAQFAAAVDQVLRDPRSWGHGGAASFRRVSSEKPSFRVVLASPTLTDSLCARAGLDTEGKVSCFNGDRAIINQNRWETGVPWFGGDLPKYRAYVLNHEIGHALGRHHEQCPGAGRLAPVMQEQTYGMQGCRTNGWPYPTA